MRKIIHVDMDAYYASIEQRDRPELKGKPVVVGGKPEGRGVVAAASYEARKFGIRSAISSRHAYRLCPSAIFLPARFDVYRSVSRQIMEIFNRYTDLVEPLSLDEAFLDVTVNKLEIPLASEIAKRIKAEILAETGLTASAGVAPNKFIAKIASDYNKPNGLTVIPPEKVDAFLIDLPVRKLPGVGPVTEQRMASAGILTVRRMREFAKEELQALFGKSGAWYYHICRGEDERPVISDWERKSVGVEDTFAKDLTEIEDMRAELKKIAEKLSVRLKKREMKGRTVTLKMTYADFEKITRSKTLAERVCEEEVLYELACELLTHTEAGPEKPVRLLGMQVANFHELPVEFPLQMEFLYRS